MGFRRNNNELGGVGHDKMGCDALEGVGIKFDFTDLIIEWDGSVNPCRMQKA